MTNLSIYASSTRVGMAGNFIWVGEKVSNFTAAARDAILADTSGGAWTLTLPASPAAGDTVAVSDSKGAFAGYNLTVGRNGSNIMGAASDLVLDVSCTTVFFTYADSTYGWIPTQYAVDSDALLLPGYIDGFILANNGTDALNDIDVGAGTCCSSTGTTMLRLSAAITKRLDAAWAVGTNAGGLDTGSEATSTWYHIWVIKHDVTGAVDALYSTSATAPTMPSGYTFKRRVGSVYNDAAGNILAFSQFGEQFLWKVVVNDVNAATWSTTASSLTLSVPPGVKVRPIVAVTAAHATATPVVVFTDPDCADIAPVLATRNFDLHSKTATVPACGYTGQRELYTNTSAQLRVRADTTSVTGYLVTHGWWDLRGKL